MVKETTCKHCGELIEELDACYFNGGAYCQSCGEEMVSCRNCDQWIHSDDSCEHGDAHYCEDCYNDIFMGCARCGKTIERDDSIEVDGDFWCEECTDNHSVVCACCDSNTRRWNDTADGEVCNYCYEEYYNCCYSCDEMVHRENGGGCGDDEWRCDECRRNYCDDEDEDDCCSSIPRSIYDYSYRIDPMFTFGKEEASHRYVYGVELEVDKGGESHLHAGKVKSILEDHVICKHDGSLSEGFEVVSHPLSLQAHKELKWKEAMDYLSKNNYRSHDTSTCGLHVHINRQCLGDNTNEQDQTIAKMLLFVEMNWTAFVKFTRRKQENLDSWAKRYGVKKKDTPTSMLNKAKCGDRYRTINLVPRNTVEIRAFRGTLNYKTFYASLELVDAMVRFCRHKSVGEVQAATLKTLADCYKTKYLLGYLAAKGLMNEPQDELPNLLFDCGEKLQTQRTDYVDSIEEQLDLPVANRGYVVEEVYNNRYRINVCGRQVWLGENDVCESNSDLPLEFQPGDQVRIIRNPLNVTGYDVVGCMGRVLECLSGDCEIDLDGRYVVELENDYAFIFHGSLLQMVEAATRPEVAGCDDTFVLSA